MAEPTATQMMALSDILRFGDRTVTPYQAGWSVTTFRRLAKHGLLACTGGSGDNSTWRVTDAGRAALSSSDAKR